jgi:hypothetical protein
MDKAVFYILIGGLFAWRIYRRVRRNIGRQKLQPRRIIASLVIFSIFSIGIIFYGVQFPRLLAGFGGGIVAGAILGFVGLKLTQFETTHEGHFYTPNTHIGVGLSILLVGRVLYRMIVLNNVALAPNHPPPMQSPLTYFILGLTFGYYIVYYIGLFVHTHDKEIPGQNI